MFPRVQQRNMKCKTMTISRPLPSWVRFYLYGMHGLLDEIVFTALFDLFLEPEGNIQLKGYTTLFTFIIYGSCSFVVEHLYAWMYLKHGVQWYIRLPIYLAILYFWEFTAGLILRQFDACSWDYSHYPLNLMGLVTLIYAPAWAFLCMYQDFMFGFLLSLRITTEVDANDVEKKDS